MTRNAERVQRFVSKADEIREYLNTKESKKRLKLFYVIDGWSYSSNMKLSIYQDEQDLHYPDVFVAAISNFSEINDEEFENELFKLDRAFQVINEYMK